LICAGRARPGDFAEIQFWTDLIIRGGTRADVALGFTESLEFQVSILGQIDNGIVVI
jgi:hypothetical protein